MNDDGFISIIGSEDQGYSRSDELTRVTRRISVDELSHNFGAFMRSLEQAFAVKDVQTSAGDFELKEIQFSAELSAEGKFSLLGTGVGVTAGSTLTFILSRKEPAKGA